MLERVWRRLALSCSLIFLLPLEIFPAERQFTLTAAPGAVEIEDGRTAQGWFYDGLLPGPTLRVVEGDTLRVKLLNRLPEPTTIHWHGLPVPWAMDGVPGITQEPVAGGGEFDYEFVAGPSGTYFFHPHVGLQLDRGLYGVLIVDPRAEEDPAVDQEFTLLLDDLLAGAPVSGRDPVYAAYLINGRTSRGQVPIVVSAGERIRLRLVNASAGTHYVVAVDGHPMTVVRADGRPVQPVEVQAIPIGAGERYDVLVAANRPGQWSIAAADIDRPGQTLARAILAYRGAAGPPPPVDDNPLWLTTGDRLTYGKLASLAPSAISPRPSRTQDLVLAGAMMGRYAWTINGQAFPGADPLPVAAGEVLRWNLLNRSMAWHPMHLHGHFFRLLGSGGGVSRAPLKDTVLLHPAMMGPGGIASSAISVELDADNPGDWAFHCHMLYHAEAGMMRLLQYQRGGSLFVRADSDGNGALEISDAIDTLRFLFSGGVTPACLDAADSNDDGEIDIADPVATLSYLFLGLPPPPQPFPEPGEDPTPDELGCQ